MRAEAEQRVLERSESGRPWSDPGGRKEGRREGRKEGRRGDAAEME